MKTHIFANGRKHNCTFSRTHTQTHTSLLYPKPDPHTLLAPFWGGGFRSIPGRCSMAFPLHSQLSIGVKSIGSLD